MAEFGMMVSFSFSLFSTSARNSVSGSGPCGIRSKKMSGESLVVEGVRKVAGERGGVMGSSLDFFSDQNDSRESLLCPNLPELHVIRGLQSANGHQFPPTP